MSVHYIPIPDGPLLRSSVISVIYVQDLPGYEIWDSEMSGFQRTSYGDAEWTLQTPAELLLEASDRVDAILAQQYPGLADFVEALRVITKHAEENHLSIFIALQG